MTAVHKCKYSEAGTPFSHLVKKIEKLNNCKWKWKGSEQENSRIYGKYEA